MSEFKRRIWQLGACALVAGTAVAVIGISPAGAFKDYKTTVTIKVQETGPGEFRLSGEVKNDREACRFNRIVQIWKKVPGPDQRRNNVQAQLDGSWRTGAPGPGTYYAKVDQERRSAQSGLEKFVCLADRSPDIKVG